jgi:hypothetical protein
MPSDESDRIDDLEPITVKETPVNKPTPAQGKEEIRPFADEVEIEEIIAGTEIVKRE